MLLNHLHYAGLTNHCISSLFWGVFFPQGAADLLIDMFFFCSGSALSRPTGSSK